MLDWIHNLIWGWGMIGLILAAGVYLSIRTRFVQVRCLARALKYMLRNESDGRGEVSSFGALCTALSATIGTGNIVGVATAITLGGPGALLWMLLAAFFGMATKYAEGLLAVLYRREPRPGHFLGGPFCYIERGLGRRLRWLARLFALFGAAAGVMGIGTITQVSGIASAVNGIFDPGGAHIALAVGGCQWTWATVVTSIVVALCAGLVIIGGMRRIAKVSQVVVPFMAVAYILFSLLILIGRIRAVPAAVALIVESAFCPAAAGGAIGGLTIKTVLRAGVGRGIFSNEAGLGSAPIAAASARTNDPVRQGLVTMTGTLIDTMVVCTLTGLSIVVTGAWDPRVTGERLEGSQVTARAWQSGLPFDPDVSQAMLAVFLIFFAFTTILGWNCYGERCLEYLTDGSRRALRLYRGLYIASVLIGPYLTVGAVWSIADIFNGLMAFPNLIALFLLAGVVERRTGEDTARPRRKRQKPTQKAPRSTQR